MSESNSHCCGCAYLTPPWWVTMGFVQPNLKQNLTPPASTTTQSQPPQQQTGGQQTGGQQSGGGDPLGGIIGTIGGLLGGLL